MKHFVVTALVCVVLVETFAQVNLLQTAKTATVAIIVLASPTVPKENAKEIRKDLLKQVDRLIMVWMLLDLMHAIGCLFASASPIVGK